MASNSLTVWRGNAAAALNELEAAHTAIGGTGRGRIYATQQINRAYAVLLSSRFQAFCRDLHSEAADHLTKSSAGPDPRLMMLRVRLTDSRKLDTGNPNPGNLGSDFGRFGIQFWDGLRAENSRNEDRRKKLEELNAWRNAIAHQDFDPVQLGGRVELRLETVRQWRSCCNGLALAMDRLLCSRIEAILGRRPW
jgi:hypothetical protein